MSRAVGQYKCRIRASRVLNQNSQDINRQKKTGSAFSDALLMSRFQISMLAPQLKICAPHGFEKSRGVNSLINYRIAKQSENSFLLLSEGETLASLMGPASTWMIR